MKTNDHKLILGMNKAIDMASVCILEIQNNTIRPTIYLHERYSRKKRSADYYYQGVEKALTKIQNEKVLLSETSYDFSPREREEELEAAAGFTKVLEKKGLSNYCSLINPEIPFYTHHWCHAEAVASLSPYEKALILVIDGGGSNASSFLETSPEFSFARGINFSKELNEKLSIYSLNNGELKCLEKQWQIRPALKKDLWKEEEISWGQMFERASNYIFGNSFEAGKVMGLAKFSKGKEIKRFSDIAHLAPKEMHFRGKGKKDWESSQNRKVYEQIATSLQEYYTQEIFQFTQLLKEKYPEFNNLILTGGCALNCSANQFLLDHSPFKSIYIPPFPGDECVSYGAALIRARSENLLEKYSPLSWDEQTSFLGPEDQEIPFEQVRKLFEGYKIEKPKDLAKEVADLIYSKELVAIFRGRSEVGPRALGHRSILAHPGIKEIKAYLNDYVKGREDFRPYGGTVLDEYKTIYFKVNSEFESPFMSFAPEIKMEYRDRLIAISHVDHSSRIQNLKYSQEPFFYSLIHHFGEKSGIFCVLNTSLNVMGEPIVETPEDAARFFSDSPVKYLVLNNYFISKKA